MPRKKLTWLQKGLRRSLSRPPLSRFVEEIDLITEGITTCNLRLLYSFYYEEIDLITEGITTLLRWLPSKLFNQGKKLTWLQKGLRRSRAAVVEHFCWRNWPDYRRDYDAISKSGYSTYSWRRNWPDYRRDYDLVISALLHAFISEEIDLITEGITTIKPVSIIYIFISGRNWPDYRRDYDPEQ